MIRGVAGTRPTRRPDARRDQGVVGISSSTCSRRRITATVRSTASSRADEPRTSRTGSRRPAAARRCSSIDRSARSRPSTRLASLRVRSISDRRRERSEVCIRSGVRRSRGPSAKLVVRGPALMAGMISGCGPTRKWGSNGTSGPVGPIEPRGAPPIADLRPRVTRPSRGARGQGVPRGPWPRIPPPRDPPHRRSGLRWA